VLERRLGPPVRHPVDDDEAAAANVLRVGDEVWMSAGHPATAKKVAAGGFTVVTVDISELQRAEAGLTCLSILLPALAAPRGAQRRGRRAAANAFSAVGGQPCAV
jgi:hypothetical protein